MEKGKIVILKNGPYLVTGGVPLEKEISEVGEEGVPERWVRGRKYPSRKAYRLCRCGQSKTKPFCDGTHASAGFDGTETTNREPYFMQAVKVEGPAIDMMDAVSLCAGARFCHAKDGFRNLVANSGDVESKKLVMRIGCDCPSGRLVACDKKTGKSLEPDLAPSISLIEDPQAKSSGPIWVKGGVPVESDDGRAYETRNRVTLCRCGKSTNKPLCDGSHITCRFNDGDESIKN
jgi:CDGSH-type Zn-finger protein